MSDLIHRLPLPHLLRGWMNRINCSWRLHFAPAVNAEPAKTVAEVEPDASTGSSLRTLPNAKTVLYLTTEAQANEALSNVTEGDVGFDTEFTDRRPTREEHAIYKAFPAGGANRRYALLGWQIVELTRSRDFPIAWDNIGLRLVQLSHNDVAWVLDMYKIRAFPSELRRILMASNIKKVGVGLIKDISIMWDDTRTEMRNLVDVGMMARLILAEKYPKPGYGNLALKTCVEEVLGVTVGKELTKSDWRANKLSEDQIQYAALDAVASSRLYEVLKIQIVERSEELGKVIPEGWYTFNTRMGEPARLDLAADGGEIVWKPSDCTWFSAGKFLSYYP
ncbi:ribonuclease H-like domain-containing protein [Mycena polygramma]|nr:ribonuclease H-like domain-containing protein [Mycena polygramma]